MSRRSYDQYCSMATALDVVGERWTLLIIRELLLGPARFTDLLKGLPGIGRNMLAQRLRHLERENLVTRSSLPGPTRVRVYELTEDGAGLGPAMAELGRWGVKRLGLREPRHFFRPGWAMFPLSYMADVRATEDLDETYEFRVDSETFHLRIRDGTVRPRSGPAAGAELVVTMDSETLTELMSRSLSPVEAIAAGRVQIDGSQEALAHSLALWPEEESIGPERA